MTRRTKIVATLGPASGSPTMIRRLLKAGVNVFRLNFSHGDADQHREYAASIRDIAAEIKCFVAILGDLQGPKIRIGDLQEPVQLAEGMEIVLTAESGHTGPSDITVDYPPLARSVTAGDTLLLDDGMIRLQVRSVSGEQVHCEALGGGTLKSRKGLNRLGGGLSAPAITEKDFADIELAMDIGVDYLAVSFPASAADLDTVRERLQERGAGIGVIAKIERAEVVASDSALEAMIAASDGVLVARGDLGVEVGDAQLIGIQKKMIRMSRQANKPVITATQMMESMISSPVPTRAEVFDVANAVIDGTDAVMLSAETATGQFPCEAVRAMADTCIGAEQHLDMSGSSLRREQMFQRVDEAIAMSAIDAANHLDGITANICLTESGNTALLMSRFSTASSIYGIARDAAVCRRMALYRGVVPLQLDLVDEGLSPDQLAMQALAALGAIAPGERVTITHGDISGAVGMTNTLRILTYQPDGAA